MTFTILEDSMLRCVKMGQVRGRAGRGRGEDGEMRGDEAVSEDLRTVSSE